MHNMRFWFQYLNDKSEVCGCHSDINTLKRSSNDLALKFAFGTSLNIFITIGLWVYYGDTVENAHTSYL